MSDEYDVVPQKVLGKSGFGLSQGSGFCQPPKATGHRASQRNSYES
jgi:hypothetical protein